MAATEVYRGDNRLLLLREEYRYDHEISKHRQVCDFIAGMTDRYALDLYAEIFLPKPWSVL